MDKQTAIRLLENIATDCSQSNWDGYQAAPIDFEVINKTKNFIETIETEIFDIVPLPSGEIELELKNLFLCFSEFFHITYYDTNKTGRINDDEEEIYNLIKSASEDKKSISILPVNEDDEKIIDDLVKRKIGKLKIHKFIPKNNRVILFLDFDGVTHHYFPRKDKTDEENQYFYYLSRIEKILKDYPEVDIVISSDWRLIESIGQLRNHFSENLQNRVIGITECVNSRLKNGVREKQILDFLKEYNLETVPWIALDDTKTLFTKNCGNLVLCNDYFGDEEEFMLRRKLEIIRNNYFK